MRSAAAAARLGPRSLLLESNCTAASCRSLAPSAHARRPQALQVRLEATVLEAQEHQDRITVMMDHLKNVKQELGFTQSRVESKTKELETESHIKTLTEGVMACPRRCGGAPPARRGYTRLCPHIISRSYQLFD